MPCHMWRWVSTKPGATIMREASITSALGALILGRTAEILPPSISTSACSKSPTVRSRVSTQPPLIRIARPEAVAPLGCCARTGPPVVPITVEAATAVAAVVQRNWRRDSAGDELHAPQKQDELAADLCTCVMETSRVFVVVCRDATAVQAALPARTTGADVGRCPPRKDWNKNQKERMPRMRPSPTDRRLVPLVRDFLEHLGQVRGLILDDLVELLGGVGHADDELRRELRLDLGRPDNLDDVAIDLLDDRTRHARRRH